MSQRKKLDKRILCVLLCITLVLSGVMVPTKQVQAETTKELGTAMITDPMAPTKKSTVWTGNYVYFGKYNSQLIKYRVLDANTTDYSADGKTQTMLLDCDRILYNTLFDQDGKANETGKYANDWSVSDVKSSLNGADFLEKEGVFTSAERNAIAESTVGSHALTTDSTTGRAVTEQNLEVYENYVALAGDKVFLLDVEDVCNEAYGYTRGFWYDIVGDYYYGRQVREKKDLSNQAGVYWLRSAQDKITAGSVSASSTIGQWNVNYTDLGVSPAFNLNLSSVLFSSVVSETNSNGGTSYKLTLIDSDMTIAVKGVTKNGSTITIPYTISGGNSANATQVSVLVLDKEYTAGNTNQAKILDYQKVTTYVTANSATYTLPDSLSGKQAGSDYHIYILAEDVNGERETDYASKPVELHLWEAPTVTAMNFGTKGIIDPAMPNSTSDAWKGCYVYFGNYDNSPVKYRVLDADTTDYSADGKTQTMLLDCDSVLYSAAFDGESPYSPVWKDSPIYNSLNGAGFLNQEGVFTETEKNVIATSTVGSHALTTDSETGVNVTAGTQTSFENYVALSGEKIFFLDVEDVSNGAYGYSMTSGDCTNRKKAGNAAASWWLRSVYSGGWSYVGDISSSGSIYYGGVDNDAIGVSPALNLNLSSVLFSSAGTVSKSSALTSESTKIGTTTNTDWKLTLKDSGKAVALTEGRSVTKASNGTITVPYTYTDSATSDSEKVNQISVMITDKTYGSESAQILYYGALDNVKNTEGTDSTVTEATIGTGTFALPSGLTGTLGTDYHIYLLAEHVNADNSTDYASEPLEIEVKAPIATVEVPSIDTPIAELPLETELEVSEEGVSAKASVTWKQGETKATGNAESNTTYQAFVTLTAKDGYAFMDTTGATLNGKAVDSKNVTLNQDGTLTVACGEYKTTARKITEVAAPTVPTQFASYYTADNVLDSTELGATVKVTLEGVTQPNPKDMKVEWTLANANGTAYDATPSATNTFKWTVTASEYATYDVNGKVMEGTVAIQNKDSEPSKEDTEVGTITVKGAQVSVNGDGTATYVAPTNTKKSAVTIPATVKIDGVTYKVTAIEKNAFRNNKYIKSITIGKNVKTIGANAFYKCTKLKTVKFGSNVTTIGDKAFYKCTALTKISLPGKVKTIGKSAFYGCKKVRSITIGKSVSKIGAKAFYGCSKVKTLTIKSTKLTTKKIGSKAFTKTPKSMTVKIPKKKFNAYKSMLVKRGVNKKAKFKKN